MTLSVSDGAGILYSYGYAATSDLSIPYAYAETNLQTNDLGLVSQYQRESDRWERRAGHWGWSTQEIGNYWPRWADARINVGGDTQKLLNAWGQHHDGVKLEYARSRRNFFLETAETTIPDLFGHAGVRPYEAPIRENTRNFLLNPGFSLVGLSRRMVPTWWSTELAASTGDVECVTSPAFSGTHSVRMSTDDGEDAYLRQYTRYQVEKGYSLTASLWYMVPISEGTVTGVTAELQLWVIYSDGTPGYVSVDLEPGTDGEWVRATATLALTKATWVVTYRIQIKNRSGNAFRLYAGGAQCEVGARATPWSHNPFTPIPRLLENETTAPVDVYVDLGTTSVTEEIVSGDPITYTARRQRVIHLLGTYDRTWYEAWPSRATTELTTTPPVATSQTSLGWYALPNRERFTTGWRIANNKIEQYNLEITGETIAAFEIGETHLDEDHTLSVGIDREITRTLEALCVVENRIWVLCTETTGGVTKRVVKFLHPQSRWAIPLAYEQNLTDLHLECLGDVAIDVTTGTADFIGVTDRNPNELVVRIDGSYYLIALEYDYGYIDYETRQVIMRTPFDGNLVTV